jgi:transposase InsO family protein
MKELGIKAWYRPKYVRTTVDSDFSSKLKNMIKRDFSPASPDRIWLTDITYIWTKEDDFVYLVSVMDAFSRKIIAWKLSKSLEVGFVIDCIRIAKERRKTSDILVIHSDRGSHYISKAYIGEVGETITRSYSRCGNPWDNAPIGSFHALIKREWLRKFKIINYYHAYQLIFEYIEAFYNTIRIHGTLQYLSPAQFEKHYYRKN